MSDALPLHPPPVPAVLRLVQTVVAGRWRASGEALYREVARLVEAGPGREILVLGGGDGVTTEWLAARTGASVTGVDPDVEHVARAERRRRAMRDPLPIAFEAAPLEDLPHENAVFDAVIVEPTLSSAADVPRALAEAVRVIKPFGAIVLLQPTWTSETDEGTRELLVERLGLRPRFVVEWKQLLRDAGVVELQVQDWSSGGPRPSGSQPAVSPRLSLSQKMQIVGRAWSRLGWREARGAVERETQLLDVLSRERALGFHLIRGVRWPHEREP